MKTKLALLFLPAFMVLSSCGAVQNKANDEFLEDTTAQSELFGGQDEVAVRANKMERAAGESISTPKIGYQIKYDSGTDKIAIRFIAAIKEFNVNAYWRRGVAAPDGSIPNSKDFSDDGQEAKKYYLSLSDGVTTYTAGEGDFAGYSGFVVYTMHNIPYTANKDSYVAAYVNLVGNEEGEDVHNNSLALAVKIEKKTNYVSNNVFVFNPTMSSKHFLEGTINGVLYDGITNGLYEESDPSRKGDENYAWYEDINLKSTDSFGSFYYDHDRIFQYFGHDSFFSTSAGFLKASSLSGYNASIKNGCYKLYISMGSGNPKVNENCVYTTLQYFNESVDIWLQPSEKWLGNTNRYSVHYFDSAANPAEDAGWVSMVLDGEGIYKATIPAKYRQVIFCAMNKNTSANDWDNKWNQTGDVSLSSMLNVRSCFVKSNNDWNYHADDHFIYYAE